MKNVGHLGLVVSGLLCLAVSLFWLSTDSGMAEEDAKHVFNLGFYAELFAFGIGLLMKDE